MYSVYIYTHLYCKSVRTIDGLIPRERNMG